MKAVLIALTALAATAVAGPAKRQQDYTIVCETSDGSPSTEGVTELINNLKGHDPNDPEFYCVVGSGGNDCSPKWETYSGNGDAAFQACGANGGGRFGCSQGTSPNTCPGGRCNGIMPIEAATMLGWIQDQCLDNGRVGGFVDYENGDFKLIKR